MEEMLKQILLKLDRLDTKIDNVNINLVDKINSMEKKMNNRFDIVEKNVYSIENIVADLVEFRTDIDMKLKKIK